MFGFRASPMGSRPLLERPHKLAVDAAHEKIGHFTLHPLGEIVDIMCPAACRD
jgi:hypothetical protein